MRAPTPGAFTLAIPGRSLPNSASVMASAGMFPVLRWKNMIARRFSILSDLILPRATDRADWRLPEPSGERPALGSGIRSRLGIVALRRACR